jgi:hypothetical protein
MPALLERATGVDYGFDPAAYHASLSTSGDRARPAWLSSSANSSACGHSRASLSQGFQRGGDPPITSPRQAGSRFGGVGAQGGDGQKQGLELSTLPDVENVVLAASQGHQRPRRAADEKGEAR